MKAHRKSNIVTSDNYHVMLIISEQVFKVTSHFEAVSW